AADLRLQLGKQTSRRIGLLDGLAIERENAANRLAEVVADGAEVVLIDLLDERQLATVGSLIARSPFVVGSSGVNAALAAHWNKTGTATSRAFAPAGDAGPVVAVCGSCSPVTAE